MQFSKLLTVTELRRNPKAQEMVRQMDISRIIPDDDTAQHTRSEDTDKPPQAGQPR
jgi:hypothetical protein